MGLLYPLPCSLLLFVLEMPVWLSGLSLSHRETCPGSWPPHALPTPSHGPALALVSCLALPALSPLSGSHSSPDPSWALAP